jgi:hypothetical protein
MHICEDSIMKYTQTLFEKAGIKYNQGDLFKVHCTPVWN